MTDLPFQIYAATHPGRVRSRNEDSFIVRPEIGVAAVSDGMGGHAAGDVASKTVICALEEVAAQESAEALLTKCKENLIVANRWIRDFTIRKGGGVVGATLVLLLTHDARFTCMWAGDSRAYLLRDGAISQITTDHNEAETLFREGVLTREEAKNWPRRNVITRAVGVADNIQFEVTDGAMVAGDIFVLCSDGLTTHVEDNEIAELTLATDPQVSCESLIDLALARGGSDNVTVIVLCYKPSGTDTEEMRTVFRPGAPFTW